MSEQPTNEQIIVNDLVNQLQEKETAIIGYRVTITQLRAIIAATEAKEEAVETVEDKKKKEAKD